MKKKSSLPKVFTCLIAVLITATGCLSPQAAQDPKTYLPEVQRSNSPASPVILPPADEAASRIKVPNGFAIRIFAQNLSQPRLMTVGPDGWVYVALYGSGQIARLPDKDQNGLADQAQIVASGLTSPHNMEFHDGYLYVAELGKVERLSSPNASGVYQTRQLVTSNIAGPGGHSSRTLHFGPDGKLYVSGGSSCNICVEDDPRRAAILRFNPDGSIPADNPFAKDPDTRKQPVWAWGLRNSVDFLWSSSGMLWADHNGSDGLGDNIPPEEIIIPVQGGRWYGWPYCYTPKLGLNQPTQAEVADTRLTPPAGQNCGQAVPALLTDLAHSAPLGMTAAARTSFPADFRDDIFIAYHGSWNTSPTSYRDCKVERVTVQNGTVTSSETFADGWRAAGKPCGDPATYGRPAGVAAGSDGALYISDDAGGRVYRVVYTGQ